MVSDDTLAKTLRDLEWAAVLERISVHTVSALASTRLRATQPAPTLEAAESRAAPVRELLAWMAQGGSIEIRAVPDVRDTLARAERAAMLSAKECLELRIVLEQAERLRNMARTERQSYPALSSAIDSDAALSALLAELERCIEPDGTVSDRASGELGRARARVREAKKSLLAKLDQQAARYHNVLRDRYHTEIDGRFCLPVRSDAEFRVEGIVLGSSASGGTLYVEPREVTEQGNRLKVLQADAERAEARVLSALSSQAHEHANLASVAFEACLRADQLNAIASWASITRSICVKLHAAPTLSLRSMRHPLLIEGQHEVVANDLSLDARSGLILSGPNAGGKTVALKCLGLAALMSRCGLPLPVAPESTIGWFEPIVSDIGDSQSLSLSLSTFTAHITRLAECIEQARHGALFLLDEVAAGTDPDQGSALAVAIITELVARQAAVAVTTHYERLKRLGETDDRFENACVGFNVETMQPTFKVTLGTPGASAALAVAERFGIPKAVVERAKCLLPEETVRREHLITRLEMDRAELDRLIGEARSERDMQTSLRAELEVERQTVRAKERAKLERDAQQLTAAVRDARAELRNATQRLRDQPITREALRDIAQSINTAAASAAIGAPLQRALRQSPASAPVPAQQLTPGAEVFLVKLNTHGKVLKAPSRGQVQVAAGPLKVSVSLADIRSSLRPAKKAPAAARPRPGAPAPGSPSSAQTEDLRRTTENTCDVRGLRVDEALDRIDAFISQLLGEGHSSGFVLHGHGTGALKSAIRKQAKSLPFVADAHAASEAQGGDAFTVLIVS